MLKRVPGAPAVGIALPPRRAGALFGMLLRTQASDSTVAVPPPTPSEGRAREAILPPTPAAAAPADAPLPKGATKTVERLPSLSKRLRDFGVLWRQAHDSAGKLDWK